jgi:hypothetical protein
LALFQRAQILEMNENQAIRNNKAKHNPQTKSTSKTLTIFATPNFTRPDDALHAGLPTPAAKRLLVTLTLNPALTGSTNPIGSIPAQEHSWTATEEQSLVCAKGNDGNGDAASATAGSTLALSDASTSSPTVASCSATRCTLLSWLALAGAS